MQDYITVPKKLIFEYASKMSANAFMILASMFDFIICCDDGRTQTDDQRISEFTGIDSKNLSRYIKELINLGLVCIADYYMGEDDSEIFIGYLKDKRMRKGDYYRYEIGTELLDSLLERGYVKVPKSVLKDPQLTSNAKVLYTLHLALHGGENKSSYAGREFIGKALGMSERTVTNLNDKLVRVGLLEKQSTTATVRGSIKTYNSYTPLIRA